MREGGDKPRVLSLLGREVAFDPRSVSPRPLPENGSTTVTSMALDVSGSCNLRCTYCAEAATMPPRPAMPRHILRRAVEALFEWAPEGAGVSIHLGSGEALLQPRAVREIGRRAREVARSQGRPLALYLTTNGTRLNDAVTQWLIEDDWNVKISLDGGAEIHDRHRVDKKGRGTYRRIERAVRGLAAKIPERFSTTSVLCRGTDPGQVFHDLAAMGVRRIELVPVAAPNSSSITLGKDDLAAYRGFILDYVQRIAMGENLPAHIRFQKRLQRVLGYGNTQVPCGAGRNFLATGPDGTLYPCFRFVGLRDYSLGTLDSGPEPEGVQRFINGPGRPYEHRAACERCWAAALCGGPCFACAELLGGSKGFPPQEYCSMVRSEAEAALWLADVLREDDPRRLLELVGAQMEGYP